MYAGIDPLTGKQVYLRESAPSAREAERVRTRLLAQVQGQRTVTSRVALAYVLDGWLEVQDGTTLGSPERPKLWSFGSRSGSCGRSGRLRIRISREAARSNPSKRMAGRALLIADRAGATVDRVMAHIE